MTWRMNEWIEPLNGAAAVPMPVCGENDSTRVVEPVVEEIRARRIAGRRQRRGLEHHQPRRIGDQVRVDRNASGEAERLRARPR